MQQLVQIMEKQLAATARHYIIPTQHFDIIWRLPVHKYRRIREHVIATFLDLLTEFPTFKVTLVQAIALRHFIEDRPEDRERLLKFIGEGRFEIAWGGVCLIDLNLVCGESIIRNLLYGKLWLEEELGAVIETANFSDAFGINGQMPQVISGFGIDSMTGARMAGTKGKIQHGDYGAFLWEGIDGTRALVYVDAVSKVPLENLGLFYGWGVLEGFDEEYDRFQDGELKVDVEERLDCILNILDDLPGNPVPVAVMGETHLPSKEVVSAILEAANNHRLKFATQSEFINAVRDTDLPVLCGEFNPQFTGCYSTRVQLKQLNRLLESKLISIEMLTSINSVYGPIGKWNSLSALWERLSLVQFHDALGGCHDDATFAYIMGKCNNLLSEADHLLSENMEGLAALCDTGGPGDEAIVVFNPSPHRDFDYILVPRLSDSVPVDNAGNLLPCQRWDGGMLVRAPLRPCGASVLWARHGDLPDTQLFDAPEQVQLLTDTLEVCAEGQCLSITDRASGRHLLWETPSILLLEDTGTLWTENYTGSAGKLVPSLVLYEKGPVADRLILRGEINGGLWDGFVSLKCEFSFMFFKDSAKIPIKLRLDWTGCNTKLILHLPLEYQGNWRAIHSIPFGTIERPDYGCNGECNPKDAEATVFVGTDDGFALGDWPTLHWVDVRGDGWGFALINNGTPGCRVSDNGIEIALLRSGTGYAIPQFPVKPEPLSFENGNREFDFVLIPHKCDIEVGSLENELFLPPLVVRTDCHSGLDPEKLKLVGKVPGNVSVSCIKVAEDGSRTLVIRLYETDGKPAKFDLRTGFPYRAAYASNLEEKIESKLEGCEISMRPFEILTLRFEL